MEKAEGSFTACSLSSALSLVLDDEAHVCVWLLRFCTRRFVSLQRGLGGGGCGVGISRLVERGACRDGRHVRRAEHCAASKKDVLQPVDTLARQFARPTGIAGVAHAAHADIDARGVLAADGFQHHRLEEADPLEVRRTPSVLAR